MFAACLAVAVSGADDAGSGRTREGSCSDTPVPFAMHPVVPCARLKGIKSQCASSSHLSREQQRFGRGIRQGRCAGATISLVG